MGYEGLLSGEGDRDVRKSFCIPKDEITDYNTRHEGDVSSLHVARVEELSAEESGPEVKVDTEGGHLGVGQGELLPPEVEDLPVVLLDILKTLH